MRTQLDLEAQRDYKTQLNLGFEDSSIRWAEGDVCVSPEMEIYISTGKTTMLPVESAIQITHSCPAYAGTVAYIPLIGE